MFKGRRFILFLLLMLTALQAESAENMRRTVLRRIFSYSKSVSPLCDADSLTYAYTKFSLSVPKRNALLMAVPSMYAISHGKQRSFFGEIYSEIRPTAKGHFSSRKLIELSTVPRRSMALPSMLVYLTPHIYRPTMISDDQLSPFHRVNRKYYRYRVSLETDSTAIVTFSPRLDNTLLMKGSARVDARTGRVLAARFKGEYDMVRYQLVVEMFPEGHLSLYPSRCSLTASFHFLGNVTTGDYSVWYGLKQAVATADTIAHDPAMMARVRPEPLEPGEEKQYETYRNTKNTAAPKKENTLKHVAWDMVGENLLTRINEKFGPKKQGYVSVNPILNPLYMGYNPSMGYYYKLNLKAGYQFTENNSLWVQFKCGYSFKLNQFYFKLPITWYFDRGHNGYVECIIGNGSRITNSRVVDAIKEQKGDSVKWDQMGLDYFKDQWCQTSVHYDLSSHWGLRLGLTYHRRAAVNTYAQQQAGLPKAYVSMSPNIEVTYRPLGYSGPILTALFEHSWRGLANANIGYERLEIDGQYKLQLNPISTLQMRLGQGYFFHSNGHTTFLDYSNFRRTTIPDGWNDEWSGGFELLNSNWYNASDYYVRSNFTYESPILLTAWVPLLGHVIERERIYVSQLLVNKLHPYTEIGYGVKTRLASVSLFASFNKNRYKSFGIRAGFELFREW